jgi:TusA-related sulfurtransferase
MDEAERLDVRGLNCPLPLLKAKLALNAMAPGGRLEVLATDAGSWRDFELFCEQSGHGLIEASRDRDEFRYLLEKR